MREYIIYSQFFDVAGRSLGLDDMLDVDADVVDIDQTKDLLAARVSPVTC